MKSVCKSSKIVGRGCGENLGYLDTLRVKGVFSLFCFFDLRGIKMSALFPRIKPA